MPYTNIMYERDSMEVHTIAREARAQLFRRTVAGHLMEPRRHPLWVYGDLSAFGQTELSAQGRVNQQ